MNLKEISLVLLWKGWELIIIESIGAEKMLWKVFKRKRIAAKQKANFIFRECDCGNIGEIEPTTESTLNIWTSCALYPRQSVK